MRLALGIKKLLRSLLIVCFCMVLVMAAFLVTEGVVNRFLNHAPEIDTCLNQGGVWIYHLKGCHE